MAAITASGLTPQQNPGLSAMRKLLAAVSVSALCALTGCAGVASSVSTALLAPYSPSTAPATPSFSASPAVPAVTFQQGETLDCTSIVDATGWNNGPPNQMVANPGTVMLASDGRVTIVTGSLSSDDVSILARCGDCVSQLIGEQAGHRRGTARV